LVDQPLQGIRVIELATGVPGPYAGKLLADYGAEVIKVEPPGGDHTRREGARPGDRPEPEASPLFLHLNTNKRSVVADLSDPTDLAGVELVRRLIDGADVVVASDTIERLAAAGLAPDDLRATNPALVVAMVTPFGATGPLAGQLGGDLVAYAMGGPMHATGDPDREPMKLAGRVVEYQCGSVAALATLAAVAMAEASGRGTDVDVSNYETQASSIDRRATLSVGHQYDGRRGERVGGGRLGPIPAGIYPSADGHVQIVFAPNWMPRVAEMLEDDDLARRFASPGWIDDDEIPDLLNAALFSWTLTRTKQEAMEEAQGWGLAVMPVNDTIEVLADPHFQTRGFWHEDEHPALGRYRAPGAPFRLTDGWRVRRPAPALDGDRAEILAELDETPSGSGPEPKASSPAPWMS
jgi:crotonobetainyl-CoA:carnitine CoA-transferase CaiB-like acyl-CoA transferase